MPTQNIIINYFKQSGTFKGSTILFVGMWDNLGLKIILEATDKKLPSNFDVSARASGNRIIREAGSLAKEIKPFCGPEPYSGLTKSHVTEAIN